MHMHYHSIIVSTALSHQVRSKVNYVEAVSLLFVCMPALQASLHGPIFQSYYCDTQHLVIEVVVKSTRLVFFDLLDM